MEPKYKVGDWVTIINIRGKDTQLGRPLKKFIRRCFPVVDFTYYPEKGLIILPISNGGIDYDAIKNPKINILKYCSEWQKDDICFATPEEIEEAELRLTAENI